MICITNDEIINRLDNLIKNPKSELEYSSPFELLVAVMLSAQCTDKRVNEVTRVLFNKYNTPYQIAQMKVSELESYIKSCNYYHTKAKNIIDASKIIVNKFDGKVPSLHEDLVSLPGVGNKTANVVQAVAFDLQALPVDTHVLRVSNRLGFVTTDSPNKCESVLRNKFYDCDWIKLHHLLLLFGRYYCTARSPKCDKCIMRDICIKK